MTMSLNKFLSISLCFLVMYECYESPKPTKFAIKCLIKIYNSENLVKCGTQLSLKWNLNDSGNHTYQQKCCSIFDLWDCIDLSAERDCSKQEYLEVKDYKYNVINLANKHECKSYVYQSIDCLENIDSNNKL